jgi:hypothetical protein
MPTEQTVLTWLSNNYPSVVLGLSVGITYAVLYLRLQGFLTRITTLEKQVISQAREMIHVKIKIAKVIMTHCQRYPNEMEKLMKIEETDE